MSTAVRTHCLDASALVKLYIEEPGSSALRTYLQGQANWYTTPFCFFEALSVLKQKFKYRRDADKITEEQYHRAGFEMVAEFGARTRNVPDIKLTDPLIFPRVQQMCHKYPALDFSDAFLILSVKMGYFYRMAGDSQTVLVTADKDLQTAAEQEGLEVHLLR
jgi:predicted nucleic acid-binding protein